MSEFEDLPIQSRAATAVALVSSAANFVPLAGTAREVVEAVFGSPLAKRQQAWFEKVASAIRELHRLHAPLDSPEFVSAVVHASRIAQGTHLEKKLEMLKAAIIHAAFPDRPADLLTMRFLRFVDELDPEHFIVLRYLQDPPGWYQTHGIPRTEYLTGGRDAILQGAQLPLDPLAQELVLADLGERRLANVGGLSGMVTGASMWDALASSLGNQLIDFVTYIAPAAEA
jgi:hypothetical protein